MKQLVMMTITCLTLALAAACGGPADTSTGTPSPLAGPTPISSPAVEAGPTPESRSRQTSSSASCVFRYSPEAVRDRAFAFDGTVESVETRVDPKLPIELPRSGSPSQGLPWVTFKVNQWFKGGQSAEVAIWVPQDASRGAWPLEAGDRLLAAGEYRWGQPPEDPLAWGCGFTQRYTPEAAAEWTAAMLDTRVPTSNSDPALAVFPEPPLADLTIGEQEQTAGRGSYCWGDRNDESRPAGCADMFAIPTAQDPLRADSRFTADFRFYAEVAPSELWLNIQPVAADDELDTRDGGDRLWRLSGTRGERLALMPGEKPSVDLSLEPGLYVFDVFGRWPGFGDATYGFLVEVR